MSRSSSLLFVLATVAGCNALVGVGDLTLERDAMTDGFAPDVAAPGPASDGSRDGTSDGPASDATMAHDGEPDGPPSDATMAPIEEPDGEPADDVSSSDAPDELRDDGEASTAPDGGAPEAGIDASDAGPLPDATSAPDSAHAPDAETAGDGQGGDDGDAEQADDDAG